jgi:hypothetical protein
MDPISSSIFITSGNAKQLTYFTIIDLVFVFIWLTLILGYAYYVRVKNSEIAYYKYYLGNLGYKLFFGLFFSLFYLFVYNGGDSTAYWDLAGCMNGLFFKNPADYFNNMFYGYEDPNFIFQYGVDTGLPPMWIMREPEGFFVAKIISLFTFITGNSYLAITLIFSTLAANATWRFFVMLNKIFVIENKLIIYSCLFLPSLSFWCSGITKDTLVLISIFSLVTHFYSLLKKMDNMRLYHLFFLIFHFWLLLSLRPVLVMAVLVPFFVALSSMFTANLKAQFIKRIFKFLIPLISIISILVGLQFFGQNQSVEEYIKEAEVVQQDFTHNKLYTGKKYTIEVTDYSPIGLLKVFPESVIAGVLRPYFWEALSPTLFLNGLESIFFMYLIFRFLRADFWRKVLIIRGNDFLIFCFVFILFFAFLTGFTSILFGVLVRLRAPLLPFFGIMLGLATEFNLKNKSSANLLE